MLFLINITVELNINSALSSAVAQNLEAFLNYTKISNGK